MPGVGQDSAAPMEIGSGNISEEGLSSEDSGACALTHLIPRSRDKMQSNKHGRGSSELHMADTILKRSEPVSGSAGAEAHEWQMFGFLKKTADFMVKSCCLSFLHVCVITSSLARVTLSPIFTKPGML